MSPAVALSLTLWRGAKVGHVGAVFIGMCVSAPMWWLLIKGSQDGSTWAMGTLLIPFAPLLHFALLGGQLCTALGRPETRPWARRSLGPWLLASALPWWLALVAPAALLSQSMYGPVVWLWFSAVLAVAMGAGLSLAWTRWIMLGLMAMVMLASATSSLWQPSDLQAWGPWLSEHGVIWPLSAVLIGAAAALVHRVRQALSGGMTSIGGLYPTDGTAALARSTESAVPKPGQLGSLLDASSSKLDRRLMVAGPFALLVGSAAILRWWFPNFDAFSTAALVALLPLPMFITKADGDVRVPIPSRGLLLPQGLRRPSLLRQTLWLHLNSPTYNGIRWTRASLALGMAWGMQWSASETLSLLVALVAGTLAELSCVAAHEKNTDQWPWRYYATMAVLCAIIVGSLSGSAEALHLSMASVMVLASVLVALFAFLVIASQAKRWRRLNL